jgi:acetyl-CoA carboxylase biotin carboxyl carrier protein
MALDLEQLSALFDLLTAKGVAEFEHEENGVRLRVLRGVVVTQSAAVAIGAAGAPAIAAADTDAGRAPPSADTLDVTSPFVGSYYCSPSPDAPPFVQVGSVVRPGQTLCIIEAMKLMNEIEAECSGTIVEVFAQNGKSVEYGQRLFRIKKA